MTAARRYAAVDLGASSGRVMSAAWDGTRLQLREAHRFGNGPSNVRGHIYWDVLALWREIKSGLAHAAGGSELAGIGVDTWGVDFALLDRAGHLLGMPYHYRDGRTDGMMERLFAVVPRREVFARTGIQFMQINTLFQLSSMAQAHDPQLDAAATLLFTPDLFHYWLTGRVACEYTIASTSQMLNARARTWDRELLGRLGLPTHILREPIEPGTLLGPVEPEIQAECGLSNQVPLIAVGSHDTASAVAGVPGLDAHHAYLSSGTWSLLGVETQEPALDEHALASNLTNEGGVGQTIRLLKNVAGLWLLQACQAQWQKEGHTYSWSELQALAHDAPPLRSLVDPDASEFLNPEDMPAALRRACRRNGEPEPDSVAGLVRCALESLALKYRWVLDALEAVLGTPLEVIRIVGGGSQNRLLCQFTADATGRPVVAGPVEATAIGNVLVQMWATGEIASIAEGRELVGRSFESAEFLPRDRAIWDEAYGRFRRIAGLEEGS